MREPRGSVSVVSVTQKRIRVPLPSISVGGADLAVTVTYPDDGLADGCTALICWAGGSYNRPYWNFPAETYSFSQHMSERGYLVITVDPLGVGQSTKPVDGDEVGIKVMAEAGAGCVEHLRRAIGAGDPDQGLTALNDVRYVGVGHSVGGFLVTAQQALFSSYDAVAILGYTPIYRDISTDGDTTSMSVSQLIGSAAAEHIRAGSGESWDDKYVMLDRGVMRSACHLPDVPAKIIDADDALVVRWPRRPLVEASAGFGSNYALKVAVPVFLGFGAVDLSANPRSEAQNYPASDDITLQVLRHSGHCHNFSADRHRLWDRIAHWGSDIAAGQLLRSAQ